MATDEHWLSLSSVHWEYSALSFVGFIRRTWNTKVLHWPSGSTVSKNTFLPHQKLSKCIKCPHTWWIWWVSLFAKDINTMCYCFVLFFYSWLVMIAHKCFHGNGHYMKLLLLKKAKLIDKAVLQINWYRSDSSSWICAIHSLIQISMCRTLNADSGSCAHWMCSFPVSFQSTVSTHSGSILIHVELKMLTNDLNMKT